MKKICFTCQKGGVGKTTVAETTAIALKKLGYRVIAIDLDPQCNLSQTVIDILKIENKLYDVFKGNADMNACIQNTECGIDVICGGMEFTTADMEFMQTGREYMLRDALKEIENDYDFCIIDTSPHVGILTMNALACSDGVVIPIVPEIYAILGLTQLQGAIDNIRKYCNENLKIYGILVNKCDNRLVVTRAIQDSIEQASIAFKTKVYKTKIHNAIAVVESQLMSSNIFESGNNTLINDYNSFVDELLKDCLKG